MRKHHRNTFWFHCASTACEVGLTHSLMFFLPLLELFTLSSWSHFFQAAQKLRQYFIVQNLLCVVFNDECDSKKRWKSSPLPRTIWADCHIKDITWCRIIAFTDFLCCSTHTGLCFNNALVIDNASMFSVSFLWHWDRKVHHCAEGVEWCWSSTYMYMYMYIHGYTSWRTLIYGSLSTPCVKVAKWRKGCLF